MKFFGNFRNFEITRRNWDEPLNAIILQFLHVTFSISKNKINTITYTFEVVCVKTDEILVIFIPFIQMFTYLQWEYNKMHEWQRQ